MTMKVICGRCPRVLDTKATYGKDWATDVRGDVVCPSGLHMTKCVICGDAIDPKLNVLGHDYIVIGGDLPICRDCTHAMSREQCRKLLSHLPESTIDAELRRLWPADSVSPAPPAPAAEPVAGVDHGAPGLVSGPAGLGHFAALALRIGELVDAKNRAYGSAFAKAGDFLRLLYPNGIEPAQYTDALCIVRVFDKLVRIATDKDAFGESPWQDIAGYGLLGLTNKE